MKKRIGMYQWMVSAVVALLCLGLPLMRASGQAQAGPIADLDPVELTHFVDGLVAAQLPAIHAPGATIAVVQKGKLILAKGYGVANSEKQTPVVADTTLFRPGSITKLFVWTAVMQLVEAGQLDLNADINSYLTAFKIPATFPQPITMAHLMAHTAGFEEQGLGVFAANGESMKPLEAYLSARIPLRVRPPGELSAYSNYGAALAGYIVSQVAGMPFEEYMEEKLLTPLQMSHSSFRQPLPANLAADMATGYLYANGSYDAGDFEFVQAAPAGALSATATDLANFMIAHLQNGRFGAERILQEATARQMHSQLFSHDPKVGGFAYGFMEMTINGQHLLMHGGDTLYFHSLMAFLPAQNVGLVVSYNGSEGAAAVDNTLRAFMDRYFPAPALPSAPPVADAARHVVQVAGDYMLARSNESTPEKVSRLFQAFTISVNANDPTQITFSAPGQAQRFYQEVEPFVYQPRDLYPNTNGGLIFRTDAQGRVTHLFIENAPFSALLKLPWYLAPRFQQNVLFGCIVLFASVLVWGPIGFWLRRRFKQTEAGWQRPAAWCAGLLSASSIFFLVAFIVLFSNPKLAFGLPPWIDYLMFLPWVIALLTLALLRFTLLIWRQRTWSLPGRIHYTLTTLAALVFVGWMIYWKLLGSG